MAWNLDDYEPVEDRLAKFWADHPEGQIVTRVLATKTTMDEGMSAFIVRAAVWRSASKGRPDATGLAQESVTDRGVNSTSALENCETSAIGRALANLGYAAKGKRPSREETTKTGGGPDGSTWLAAQVDDGRFALWTPEQVLQAGVDAVKALKPGKPMTQREAESVLAHMENAYRVDFPVTDAGTDELPLGGSK